jgi:hypothetical protein
VLGEPADGGRVGEQNAGVQHVGAPGGWAPRVITDGVGAGAARP